MAKKTVESSLALDVLEFIGNDYLRPGCQGLKHWQEGEGRIGSIRWQMTTEDTLELTYELPARQGGQYVHRSYPVKLTRTPTRFGGQHIWFLCPACSKRVRKLYLPGSATYFLCRSCHDLSYRSRQIRRSPGEKALLHAEQLVQELKDPKTKSRRARTLYRETEELLATAKTTDFFASLRRPLAKLQGQQEQAPTPAPKRSRGRPKLKRPYVRRRPFTTGERTNDRETLCLRCRAFREMADPQTVTLPNGRPAIKGTCPICGAGMCEILKGSSI